MGYMSEVVFAIEADAVPTMLAWCEKHPALKQLLFRPDRRKAPWRLR